MFKGPLLSFSFTYSIAHIQTYHMSVKPVKNTKLTITLPRPSLNRATVKLDTPSAPSVKEHATAKRVLELSDKPPVKKSKLPTIGALLRRPVDVKAIRLRDGHGRTKFTYFSHDVSRGNLNRIFGHLGWDWKEDKPVLQTLVLKNGRKYFYEVTGHLTVRDHEHGLEAVYTGSGASSLRTNMPDFPDVALKSAGSEAFKRACMNLGKQFGLDFYDPTKVQVYKAQMANMKSKAAKERGRS